MTPMSEALEKCRRPQIRTRIDPPVFAKISEASNKARGDLKEEMRIDAERDQWLRENGFVLVTAESDDLLYLHGAVSRILDHREDEETGEYALDEFEESPTSGYESNAGADRELLFGIKELAGNDPAGFRLSAQLDGGGWRMGAGLWRPDRGGLPLRFPEMCLLLSGGWPVSDLRTGIVATTNASLLARMSEAECRPLAPVYGWMPSHMTEE